MNTRLAIFLAASMLTCVGQASACNTVGLSHLGSANIDKTSISAANREHHKTITDPEKVTALVNLFMNENGGWRRQFSVLTGVIGGIQFKSADETKEFIMIAGSKFARGGCHRDIEPAELEAISNITGISKEDLTS